MVKGLRFRFCGLGGFPLLMDPLKQDSTVVLILAWPFSQLRGVRDGFLIVKTSGIYKKIMKHTLERE